MTRPQEARNSFKEINLKLNDFQKHEMKFLNKFVREVDEASIKIGRFTAAVMPPTEKIVYPSAA